LARSRSKIRGRLSRAALRDHLSVQAAYTAGAGATKDQFEEIVGASLGPISADSPSAPGASPVSVALLAFDCPATDEEGRATGGPVRPQFY